MESRVMKSSALLATLAVLLAGQVQAAIVCSIDPTVATNMVDDIHFFTVTVTSDGMPAADAPVTFEVISGPNTGATDSTPTDVNGDASFVYFSDGRTGTDTILAFVEGVTTCTATKVWAKFVNERPVAFCHDVTTNAGLHCGADVPGINVDDGSFDYDGEIVSYTLAPPGPYPPGTTPVTLTVEDDGGASDNCTATITVVDTTPPVVLCPINIVTNLPFGVSNAVVSFVTPPAVDNCDEVTAVCDPPSGTDFALGTTNIVCTAVDAAGNTNQCSFNMILREEPTEPHDFTIAKLKAPKTIKLSSTVTQAPGLAIVTIVNLSDHDETIASFNGLVTLVAQSLGGACPDPIVALHNGAPNKPLPLTLAPRKKLNVAFDVTFDCAIDPLKGTGHQDYRVLATVDHSALGTGNDSAPSNDDCPRPPNLLTADKGCGVKNKLTGQLGADALTDVIVKP